MWFQWTHPLTMLKVALSNFQQLHWQEFLETALCETDRWLCRHVLIGYEALARLMNFVAWLTSHASGFVQIELHTQMSMSLRCIAGPVLLSPVN